MPFAKVKADGVPKLERKRESAFEGTEEWKALKAAIDRGFKGTEALQVTLSEDDYTRMGIQNRRTVARFTQKYLDKEGHVYRVKCFQSSGVDYVVVTAE